MAGRAQATPLTAWNFNLPNPGNSPTNFEIYLPGNQVGVDSGHYNAFTGGTESTTYNGGLNQTVLAFSGSSGFGSLIHFGFSGVVPGQLAGGERLAPVAMTWSYPSAPAVRVPVIGLNFSSLGGGLDPVLYFIMAINVEFPDGDLGANDGDESTNWYEMPYQGSYSYSLVPTGGEMQVSGGQYFTTDTYIPLDSLNQNLDPTTSPYNTTWTPIPNLTSDTLIPEPASLLLFAAGLSGLAAIRRRRAR